MSINSRKKGMPSGHRSHLYNRRAVGIVQDGRPTKTQEETDEQTEQDVGETGGGTDTTGVGEADSTLLQPGSTTEPDRGTHHRGSDAGPTTPATLEERLRSRTWQ